ncbi:hypothetical protein ACCO45_001513 [Purpureocillium lilacinum]|uniref:Uncharacterized protein n=1 Tax=Purpureocillium lilacinum TaxID=33203 RepID=A0ACC4E8N0_PURLI
MTKRTKKVGVTTVLGKSSNFRPRTRPRLASRSTLDPETIFAARKLAEEDELQGQPLSKCRPPLPPFFEPLRRRPVETDREIESEDRCSRRAQNCNCERLTSVPFTATVPPLRKQVKKMEVTQHAKYTCTFCGKTTVRRHSTGIWNCKSCKRTIAGGAYIVATPAAAAMRSTLRRLREIAEV